MASDTENYITSDTSVYPNSTGKTLVSKAENCQAECSAEGKNFVVTVNFSNISCSNEMMNGELIKKPTKKAANHSTPKPNDASAETNHPWSPFV